MTGFLNNAIVQSLIAALLAALVFWLIKWYKNHRDENKILDFMRESEKQTPHTFRSTYAISAATNLSEARIRQICSLSTKIKRNEMEKESWRLTG